MARENWLGNAEIDPKEPVAAGSTGTWTVRYEAGVAGVDEGGRIRLCWRSVSDWPNPQFTNPTGPNYTTLTTSGGSTLVPEVGGHGIRPWSRTLTIRIIEEALAPGDEVIIRLGDTSRGSPGMRAQTHPEDPFRFQFQVDPFGTGLFEPLTRLEIPVIGGDAAQLYILGPSDVVAGEPAWVQVRALDAWGNPDPSYTGTVRFSGDRPAGLPASHQFEVGDRGVRWFRDVNFEDSGTLRIQVNDDERGFAATSNPIRCHQEEPATRTHWADLHGQTEETVGTGTVPGFFSYARDIAAVQAAAHQGNDFQITKDLWETLRENVEKFHEPGRFITLHGYEWSGNTTAGGDHNIYLKEPEPPQRSSHTQIEDKSDAGDDRYPITAFYEANRGREDMIVVPHIGGRRADIQWHEPSLEPAIEIASQWGRFKWLAFEALERGYQVGFIGGSDDHSARQGWSSPTLAHHGVQGGLTAFQTDDLSREGLWQALKDRRVYGTTGPRILLDVRVNGEPMGSALKTSSTPEITATVAGAGPLDTVELLRGTEVVHTWEGMPAPPPGEPATIRIAWRGARNRGRSRALDWSGGIDIWNGAITNAEDYAIDNALDGLTHWSANRTTWNSHTCGDWDGVDLQIDGDGETRIDFHSLAMNLSFTLDELNQGTLRYPGPMLEQEVVVRRIPREPGPLETTIEWRDESPVSGVNPYWIWVTQVDGEMAWSSPVYLTFEG